MFGPNSPEARSSTPTLTRSRTPEIADYVGPRACTARRAGQPVLLVGPGREVRPDQRRARPPSPTCCPTSQAATTASWACSGTGTSRRSSGPGRPNLSHNGYQVTNAAGNLVDLDGNQINGAFLTNHPGFPGFGPINAPQTLAYMSDMLESGVPVVNGYISDIHGNENIPGLIAALCRRARRARQRQRLLYRPGAVLQPGLRRLLPAARRRRDHAEEHAVRAQLGRG